MRKVNSRVQTGGRSSVWTRPPRVTSPHPATLASAAAAAAVIISSVWCQETAIPTDCSQFQLATSAVFERFIIPVWLIISRSYCAQIKKARYIIRAGKNLGFF